MLLLAPSAYHRIQFRRHDKENMLRVANKEVLAGTVLIAFSITGAAFLITDLLFASKWATLAAGVLAALAATLWWALPLSRRLRDRPEV